MRTRPEEVLLYFYNGGVQPQTLEFLAQLIAKLEKGKVLGYLPMLPINKN